MAEMVAQRCTRQFGHTPIEKYYLRKKDGYDWGILYIDEDSGVFSAFTDYGNWSYSWMHHGKKSLKDFLITILDKSYIVEKLSGGEREFNADETKKKIVDDLVNARREQSISKIKARRLYDHIDQIFSEFGHSRSYDAFSVAAYCMYDFSELYPDYDMPVVQDIPSSLRAAQRELFIPFKELLKKEREDAKNPLPDGDRVRTTS